MTLPLIIVLRHLVLSLSVPLFFVCSHTAQAWGHPAAWRRSHAGEDLRTSARTCTPEKLHRTVPFPGRGPPNPRLPVTLKRFPGADHSDWLQQEQSSVFIRFCPFEAFPRQFAFLFHLTPAVGYSPMDDIEKAKTN